MNKKTTILISAMLFILSGLVVFTCCTIPIKKPDTAGLTENCRMFLECMYLNQTNLDKSVCSIFATGCKGANDYIMCSESKALDIRDCLLTLKK
jgi:hypothetical protein